LVAHRAVAVPPPRGTGNRADDRAGETAQAKPSS
jgi:hypothetical protein